MKRFFYAGCSFTKYPYPTWGDIIAYDKLNYKGYDFAFNLGVGGGCNQLIASRLAWADKKYNFTDQDDIAILWTTLFRESILTTWFDEPHTRWHAYGNAFNNPVWAEIPNHEYLHNIFNMLDRNMTTFHYVNKLYKPFYQGRICPDSPHSAQTFQKHKQTDVVKEMLFNYPGQHEEVLEEFFNEYMNLDAFAYNFNERPTGKRKFFSNHPTMMHHLDHAQKVVDLDSRTIAYFNNFSDKFDDIVDEILKNEDADKRFNLMHDCDLLNDFRKNSGIRGISTTEPDYNTR